MPVVVKTPQRWILDRRFSIIRDQPPSWPSESTIVGCGGPMKGILTAWGRILSGHAPLLSIEITRECPLRCPGCYAYGDDHLNTGATLRQLHDFKGQELVDRVIALVDEHQPVHVSIVGGEPLVRYRELNDILPALAARGIYVKMVTSAVREIPPQWST